jgi:CheY-like chemotaxis protein
MRHHTLQKPAKNRTASSASDFAIDYMRMADAVLVVEDDAELREMMAQRLHLAGFAPVTASNGHEALQLLRMGFPAKLILLDLTMPLMDGWAFRAVQRRDPYLADIPVIVVTARDPSGVDAAACCAKPVDADDVVNKVRMVCASISRVPRRPPTHTSERPEQES